MTPEDVIERCSADDLKLVRVFYVDSAGVTRGRVVDADDVADVLEDGVNLAQVQQAFTALDYPVEGTGLASPVGEVRLVPDPDSFRVLPYADRAAAMMGDMVELDGTPWAVDPRSRLAAYVDDIDHDPVAAFESEFYLARETEEGVEPLDDTGFISATGMQNAHDIVLDAVEALEAQGMEFATYYPEYGPGQQELVIRHAPALRAADDFAFYRETVSAVAADHGLRALFLPKPFKGEPGSGCHLHLSLWDGDDNAFYDERRGDRYGLSDTARSFVAGVVDHAPGLLALTAPSVTSYKRLRPQSWASAFACWGHDNREAMVRVPSAQGSDPAGTTRIEYKPIDNTANPYLALLGLLAAGRDGVERGLDPGDPLEVDPATLSASERADRGVERFPETLVEAVDALDEDDVLREALGEDLHRSYVAIKREQWDQFSGSVTDWELENLSSPY